MSERQIVWYCGLLMTLSAFSVDIMLPAFSVISDGLGAEYSSVQLVIPVFIFAFGVGQFFCGPLSDRYGRRLILMLGLVVYILGAIVAAMATDIDHLLLGRILQGLGGSAGHVVSRALLRDLFSGRELGRAMAMASGVFAFGPIVAPLVGAGLMQIAGWRVIFFLMLLFAVALFVVAAVGLKETNQHVSIKAMHPKTWVVNLKAILHHPESRYFLCLIGLIQAMMMCILTVIPKIYQEQFNVVGIWFAIYFAAHGIGIPIGQIANRYYINKIGVLKTSIFGSMVLVAVTSMILSSGWFGFASPLSISCMLVLFATSYLIVFSNASTLVLEPHPKIAGFTSSLFGSVGQIVSSVIAVVVATIVGGNLVEFASVLVFLTLTVCLALLYWQVKHGESDAISH